jgi:hypothetical protein
MMLSVLSLPLFWTALAIILSVQFMLSRCHGDISVVTQRACYQPIRYWRSFIDLYLFSYSTIANTLVGYLYCIEVGNGSNNGEMISVLFVSPTISCNSNGYKIWYPIVIVTLIIVIILPPIAFVIWLTRHRTQFSNVQFSSRFGTLYEPYNGTAYWWSSFVMLRRVIFTLVEVLLVILPSFKFMIFTFIHLLSLLIHTLVQPYHINLFNKIELITLLSLTSIGVLCTAFDSHSIANNPTVIALISIFVLVPVIGFMMYGLRQAVTRLYSCYTIRLRQQKIAINIDKETDPNNELNEDVDTIANASNLRSSATSLQEYLITPAAQP